MDMKQLNIMKAKDVTETGLYYYRRNSTPSLQFVLIQVSHIRDRKLELFGSTFEGFNSKYHPINYYTGLFEGPIQKPSEEFMGTPSHLI